MSFNQSDRTKKFVKEVKSLVDRAEEPTFKAVADKLKWNNNALHLVMKGDRNVPNDVYKRYTEIYNPEEDCPEDPYKDKYIGLLEKQVSEQRDIKEHLVRLEANLKVIFEDQLAATKRVLSGQDNILRKLSDVSADRSKRPASGGKQLHKDKSGKGK